MPQSDFQDRYDDDPLAELARIVTESARPSAQPQPQQHDPHPHYDQQDYEDDEPTMMLPPRGAQPSPSAPQQPAPRAPVASSPAHYPDEPAPQRTKTAAEIEADLLADLRQSIMPSLSASHAATSGAPRPGPAPIPAPVRPAATARPAVDEDDEYDDGPTIPLASLRAHKPMPSLDDAFDDLFADNPVDPQPAAPQRPATSRPMMTPPTADPTAPTFEGLTRDDITKAAQEGRPRLKPKPMPRHSQAERRAVQQSTRSSARGLKIAASMLGFVVMAGLGFLGWRAFATNGTPTLPPVIKADTKPIKMKPDAPTVAVADPASKLQADRVEDSTRLVTRQEEPVDQVDPSGVRKIPPATSSSLAGAAPGEPARQVRTVVVRPDGSIEQQATIPAAPVRTTTVQPTDTASAQPPRLPPVPVPATAPTGGPKAPVTAVAPTTPAIPAAPAPKVTAAAPVANPTAGGAVAPALQRPVATAPAAPMTLGPATAPAAPRVAAAPEPLPVAPAAAAGGGDYMVQLSAQGSEADARRAYQQAQSRYPMLSGRPLDIQRADLGAKGVFYRVRVPGGSQEQANALCGQIKAAGGSCLVAKR